MIIKDDLGTINVETLQDQQHWQQRYKLLIQWGNCITRKPAIRHPQYQVDGCESPAWLHSQKIDNQYFFSIDSDARIVRGLAALLLSMIQGKTCDELNTLDWQQQFNQLGLSRHLSPSRNNGLKALAEKAFSLIED